MKHILIALGIPVGLALLMGLLTAAICAAELLRPGTFPLEGF